MQGMQWICMNACMHVCIKDRGGKDTDQKSQVLVDEYLINNRWVGKTYFQGFSANASKNETKHFMK